MVEVRQTKACFQIQDRHRNHPQEDAPKNDDVGERSRYSSPLRHLDDAKRCWRLMRRTMYGSHGECQPSHATHEA